MSDRNVMRAASCCRRAAETEDLQQRLLCLYDGFTSLFGPISACGKAAEAASVDRRILEAVLDGCMDDELDEPSEDKPLPTAELVNALQEALGRLTSDCH